MKHYLGPQGVVSPCIILVGMCDVFRVFRPSFANGYLHQITVILFAVVKMIKTFNEYRVETFVKISLRPTRTTPLTQIQIYRPTQDPYETCARNNSRAMHIIQLLLQPPAAQ